MAKYIFLVITIVFLSIAAWATVKGLSFSFVIEDVDANLATGSFFAAVFFGVCTIITFTLPSKEEDEPRDPYDTII